MCAGQYPLQIHDKSALVWHILLHHLHKSTPLQKLCILPEALIICVHLVLRAM